MHEHTLRLPELHLHSSLNHLYGAFLPGFLWPIILICLVHTPCLVYLRIFPCVRMRRWILLKRHLGRASLDMTPLWPPRNLFCTCVVEEVSWLREQKIWGLCRVQPPLLIALLFLEFSSMGNESPIAFNWGPHLLLPQTSFLNEVIFLASTPCLLDSSAYCMVSRVSLGLATQGDLTQCMGGVIESRFRNQFLVIHLLRVNIPGVIHVCMVRLKHMEYAWALP